MSKYDTDFYAWAYEQAALLRSRDLSQADLDNIAEEIESMGRSEKRELISRLRILFLHLLKWEYQPERRGNSWRNSILNAQDDSTLHLKDNPSLKSQLSEIIPEAYKRARRDASDQISQPIDIFPIECPWTYDQAIDFRPEIPETA